MNPKKSALRPEIPPSKVRSVPNKSPHVLIGLDRPVLTIVIVNYNGWSDVVSLVEGLVQSPEVLSGQCELIVVDNASDEPPPDFFRMSRSGLRLILRDENGGFAAGVNAGWRASRSPWLLLLNPDVQAEPELIGRILSRIQAYSSVPDQAPAVVGFALRNADGSHQPSVGAKPGLLRSLAGQFIPRSRRNYQADWRTKPGPVAWVTGACMLVESTLMSEISGMDEDFFLYYEEVALCRVAWNKGRRVEFDDSLSVVHLRPLQNRPISAKMRVIIRHAKLLYFCKHQPYWQFLALCAIVRLESKFRAGLSKSRGQWVEYRAWIAIATIARSMRQGRIPRGREVLLVAENATREPDVLFKLHTSIGSKTIQAADHTDPARIGSGPRKR